MGKDEERGKEDEAGMVTRCGNDEWVCLVWR